MLLLVEACHFKDTHIQFNSAFFKLIRNAFEEESILAQFEEAQAKLLQQHDLAQSSLLQWTHYTCYNPPNQFSWKNKIFGEWKQIIKAFSEAKKKQAKLIIWFSAFPTGHLFRQIVHTLFYRNTAQIIVLHGELAYLKKRNKLIDRILAQCLKLSFLWSKHHTKYIVLGDSILRNCSFLPTQNQSKIFSIPFPFEYPPSVNKTRNGTLKVCLFGAINLDQKGAPFYAIAQLFEKEIKAGEIQFCTIGKLSNTMKALKNPFVQNFYEDQFVAQKEFETLLTDQDIALFFYDDEQYQLGASSAMFEAINFGITILAYPNDYFAETLNHYQVGTFCNSYLEMATKIKQYLNPNCEEFLHSKNEINRFITEKSFSLQAKAFKEKLIDLGYIHLK